MFWRGSRNLPVIDEMTESTSDGAVKVADSSLLSCQELATSTSDQSICGITGVCPDKELLNPHSMKGKDPACMVIDQVEEAGIRKEISGCTSSMLNFGSLVQSSSNLVEAEPVRTLDMVVSAPENGQAVSSLFNSEPLPKASGKPLIVKVCNNLDNVGERNTPKLEHSGSLQRLFMRRIQRRHIILYLVEAFNLTGYVYPAPSVSFGAKT